VAISEYGKSIVVGALYNNNNHNTRRLLTHGTTGAAYLFRYDAPPEKTVVLQSLLAPPILTGSLGVLRCGWLVVFVVGWILLEVSS
jgi:hypothetical protein